MRSAFVNVPVFSPHVAAGSTTSASSRGLGQEEVLHDDEQLLAARGSAGCARARAARPPGSSPRSTAARSSPARRSGRSASRASAAPSAGSSPASTFQSSASSRDVLVVVPVAQARQVAVGAGLAGVLRGRLAVHLQHAGAGPADHAAQQVEVVDLAGGGRRLVGLVEALQHRREQALAGAEQLGGGLAMSPRRDAADLGRALGRVVARRRAAARRSRSCARRRRPRRSSRGR